MDPLKLNCPSCGGEITKKYRFSKMIVCGFCGQTTYITNDGLQPEGNKIILTDYGSVFKTGNTGKFKGKAFSVVGRIRFDYPDGFWDEWLLNFNNDDKEYWVQEDEGEFVMFTKSGINGTIPDFNSVGVGQTVSLNGKSVFITEKNKAVINGGEGELPFQVKPGEQADFIDGIIYGEGIVVSLEYMPGEAAFNVGEVLALSDFEMNKNTNSY